MIDLGKKNILGVLIDAVDYEAAVERIIKAARNEQSYTVSALAVHGVMTGVLSNEHRHRLNQLDLTTPDGQPVRWALNLLHKTNLIDRVYGPNLVLEVCERAAEQGLPIYLYGSRVDVLTKLQDRLRYQFPDLQIAGAKPSQFRQLSPDEKLETAQEIKNSGARLVLVGLGCPRQEVWVYEYRDSLRMPTLAVGAAFDFHAGLLPQAPSIMQDYSLEWLYRLMHEPKRLWRRYLYLNPYFLYLLLLQCMRWRKFDPGDTTPPSYEMLYG